MVYGWYVDGDVFGFVCYFGLCCSYMSVVFCYGARVVFFIRDFGELF